MTRFKNVGIQKDKVKINAIAFTGGVKKGHGKQETARDLSASTGLFW